MGRLNVAQLQGTAGSSFTVTVPEGNTLKPKDDLRILNQRFHQIPVAETPNYFATKFNPVDMYAGSLNADGTVRQQPFGNSIQSGRGTSSRDPSVTDSPAGGVPWRVDVTVANAFNTDWNNDDVNLGECAAGQTWTFSIYVKADAAAQCELLVFGSAGGNGFEQYIGDGSVSTVGTSWTRISQSITFTNTSVKYVRVRIDPITAGRTYWFDGAMVERSASPSTFSASAEPTLENPYSYKEGSIRYAVKDKKLEVYKDNNFTQTGGSSNTTTYEPVGTVGAGGGFTIAEGANNTGHNVFTSGHNFLLYEGLRYNDGTTGDETLSATPRTRQFLEFVSSTDNSDFAFHTGHTSPGDVAWPQYLCIKVSNDKYGKVLDRIRWYKHTNMVGNVNLWGSNQQIVRSNFTNTGNFTFIARLHFGGSGAGGEGQQVSRTFTNANGYRWYMLEMVDINSSELPYPAAGTQGGWAAYGLTFDKI
mgnify:CR=1 FL=1